MDISANTVAVGDTPVRHQENATDAARRQVAQANPDARTIALVVLAVLAVFYTLYFTAELLLPLVFAMMFNLLLQPAKRLLSNRLRIPAALTALLLVLALLMVILGIAAALSVPATGWITKAPQSIPMLEERFGYLNGPIDFVRHGMDQLTHFMQQRPQEGQQQVSVQQQPSFGGVGMSILQGTRLAFSQLLTLVVVLFFLLAQGDSVLRRVVEILPTFGDKRRVVQIADEIERNISGYLVTITLMNLLVGTLNGLSMWLQGMPDPLLWGTLAFLLNYIPILGPLTGVVVFFFVGVFTKPDIWMAVLPAAIYLLIHIVEGETVTPMLVAKRLTLNPVLVIVSLFVWDFIWGVPGAFLAVPLLAVTKIVCDNVAPLTPLGHILGATRES
jgi:predicted PurR-regulated permease PerM